VEQPLVQLRLLTDGDSVFVLTKDPKVMVDTLRGGQLVWSLALGEIVVEVREKVSALRVRRAYTVAVNGKDYAVELQPDLEDGGYVVECPGLPGCMSQGDTVEEALGMIRDAIRGHLAVLCKEDQGKKGSRAGIDEHSVTQVLRAISLMALNNRINAAVASGAVMSSVPPIPN